MRTPPQLDYGRRSICQVCVTSKRASWTVVLERNHSTVPRHGRQPVLMGLLASEAFRLQGAHFVLHRKAMQKLVERISQLGASLAGPHLLKSSDVTKSSSRAAASPKTVSLPLNTFLTCMSCFPSLVCHMACNRPSCWDPFNPTMLPNFTFTSPAVAALQTASPALCPALAADRLLTVVQWPIG